MALIILLMIPVCVIPLMVMSVFLLPEFAHALSAQRQEKLQQNFVYVKMWDALLVQVVIQLAAAGAFIRHVHLDQNL